jgi:ComF family protein
MALTLFARTAAPAGLPSQCEVCRSWADAALCAACLARFAAPRPRCGRCGLSLGVAAPACGACLREPPPFERTACVADYGFPWDRLVADFKFHGRAELAGVLAQQLTAAVRTAGAPLPDTVVPVPMSARRLAERGYNQAWELARRVAGELALPASASLLLRAVDAAHQVELGRAERQRNLRNAFMVDGLQRTALQGRRVALVDDVMTTGATAHAAADALLRAGAAAVDVWVLARTPDHAEPAGHE